MLLMKISLLSGISKCMKQSNVHGSLVPGSSSEFHVENSDDDLISTEVLPEMQFKQQKKNEFPTLVRRRGRLMSFDSISILKKTDHRNHLFNIGHKCGLNLNSSSSFDPIDKIICLERSRAEGLNYK